MTDERVTIPDWFFEIAKQVQVWLLKPELKERFWQFSHDAAGVDRKAMEDYKTYCEERQKHVEKLLELDEGHALLTHTEKPPKKGFAWDYENFPWRGNERTEIYCIEGWFPLKLCPERMPSRDVCIDRNESLSLDAKYYVLAMCHDVGCPHETKLLPAENTELPHELDGDVNLDDPDDCRRMYECLRVSMPLNTPYHRLRHTLLERLKHHPEQLRRLLETAYITVTDDIEQCLAGSTYQSPRAPEPEERPADATSAEACPDALGGREWFGVLSKNAWAKLLCGYDSARWDRNVLVKWPGIEVRPADPGSEHPCKWYVSPQGLPPDIAKKVRSQPNRLE